MCWTELKMYVDVPQEGSPGDRVAWAILGAEILG